VLAAKVRRSRLRRPLSQAIVPMQEYSLHKQQHHAENKESDG
jgi:hypothetical protein